MSDSAAKQAPPPDDGPEMDAPGFMDPTGGRGPAEKPKDAKKTIRFLMTYFRPLMGKLTLVYVFSASSAIFAIVGPKLMGNVTTKLFDGLKSKYIAAFTHKPMPSVDFNYIGGTLLLIVGFYLLSSLFRYLEEYILAGVSQGIVYQMKKDVNEKLARLPLKYFDSKTHGEIMSRMTNDTDNISNTLRESLGKLISNICTIIGVLMMMLTISPLLTLIALVTLPISILATTNIIKRSQKIFGVQQKELGELNGHVEEMYSGNIIVKAFGNEEASVREFKDINARFFDAAWKAQFISGVVLPIMNFVTNIGYVAICVVGRNLGRAQGSQAGRYPGLHYVLEALHPANLGDGRYSQRPAVHPRFGGAHPRDYGGRRAGTRTRRRDQCRESEGPSRFQARQLWLQGKRDSHQRHEHHGRTRRRPSPSSDRRAPARPLSSTSSCVSTRSRAVPFWSTGSIRGT